MKQITLVLLLILVLSGCSAGPGLGSDADTDDSGAGPSVSGGTDGLGGDPSGDGDGDGDGDVPTGGAFGAGGGAPGAGGAPNTGGTGGGAVVEETCFPLWDPTVEYDGPTTVQVGVRIFDLCSGPSTVGVEPKNNSGWSGSSCEGQWKWRGDCPSTDCADALVWDMENEMVFTPPIFAGTLFSYEGQVWELGLQPEIEEDGVRVLITDVCPPNPDPEHWCTEEWGILAKVSFTLVEQCQ